MNKPTSSAILASVALLIASPAMAESPLFRAEFPADRPIILANPEPVQVPFKDATEFAAPSAVVLSTAGVANGDFVATGNAGPGNFQKRPYRFTFSLNQGYDDNVYTSSFDKQGSTFTSASVGAVLTLGNGRTSLVAALSLGGVYYWDRDDDGFDPDMSFNLELSHVFSPKLRLDITSHLSYQAEPDFSTGFGQNRRNGDYVYGSLGFQLSQTFSRRFSVVYGYNVSGVYYDESTIADFENRIDQTLSLQLRYLIQPTVSLVGEYRFGIITYDAADRDSTSNFLLGGVDFTLNRRVTASIRVGAQFRDSDDAGQDTSPFVESTISYKYGERSSIQWLNRYGFEESDFGTGSSRKTYRTGLTVNQSLASRLSLNGGVFYTTSQYEGAFGDNEQTLDVNVGLVYAVSRLVSLQTGYTYTTVYSDNAFREYDRNRIYVGATLSF